MKKIEMLSFNLLFKQLLSGMPTEGYNYSIDHMRLPDRSADG